jgi:hypothetical protein
MNNVENRLVTTILLYGLILSGCSISPKVAYPYLQYRNVDVIEVSVDGDVPEYLNSSLSEIYNSVRRDNIDDGRNEKLIEIRRASGAEFSGRYCIGVSDSDCVSVMSGYKYNLDVTRAWGDQKLEYTRFYSYKPNSIRTRLFSSSPTPEELELIKALSKERAVREMLGDACSEAKRMFKVDVPVTALSSDIEYVSSACLEWLPDFARTKALKAHIFDETLSPSVNWRAAWYLERKDFSDTGLPNLTSWFHDSAPERRRIAIKFDRGECAPATDVAKECGEINLAKVASFLDDVDPLARLEAAERIIEMAEWYPRSGLAEDRERRQIHVNEIGQSMASHPDPRIRKRGLRLVDLDSLERIATNDPAHDVRKLARQFLRRLEQLCAEGSIWVAHRCSPPPTD